MTVRSRRQVTLTLAVGAAAWLAYVSWPAMLAAAGVRLRRDVVGDVAVGVESLAALTAGLLLLRAARRARAGERRSLALFGAGAVTWSAGSAAWFAFVVAGDGPPYPGPQDLGYLLMPVLAFAAVARFPSDHPRPRGVVHLVDALLSGSAALLLLWVGALGWAVRDGAGGWFGVAVNLAYPLTDVVLVVLLIDLIRRLRPARRTAPALLALGLGTMAVSDVLLLVLQANGTYQHSSLVTDATWTVGWVVVAGAALAASGPGDTDGPAGSGRPTRTTPSPVPLMLAVLALLAGLAQMTLRPADAAVTVPISAVVVGLLLAREYLTLRATRTLTGELSRSIETLHRDAARDALTGLPNRVGLERRIYDAAERSARHGRVGVVVFVDLDHLKRINDSLGHASGDRLITEIGCRLEHSGWGETIRFGGDEFVLVCSDCRPGDLPGRLDALVAACSRPLHLDGMEVRPSVSAGAAVTEPGLAAGELLRRSDVALYRAKAQGRGRAVVYEPGMDADLRRRARAEPALRAALAADRFVVHYQPVVDTRSGRLLGAEALVRWDHPELGLLGPDAFLDDAEALGLMGEIGGRVLCRATEDFASIARAGPGRGLTVAVNLSASELAGGEAPERVREALAGSGLPPSALVLEIREDVVVDRSTRQTIDGLVAAGIVVAVDDFGTGHSSLRQLGSYPASLLKVDRSFVDGLGTEPEDTFVVRAILRLARNLGLQTVAEGVETETQLRLLADLGCDAVQGWLLGRPVPFEEFVARHVRPAAVADPGPAGGSGVPDGAGFTDRRAVRAPSQPPR
jgi:diguanylate cyclase (GGDEF)-like protein